MVVKSLDFSELRSVLDEKKIEYMDFFVSEYGIAYVIAVTREKCPGCEKQKPLFEKLSDKMKSKHGARVKFFRVYAHCSPENKEEAIQCLDTFRTVAFPTYMILLRDHNRNGREVYRAIEPPMSEIERNIKTSVEISAWFKSKRM